jgi:hypothetical protein
MKYLVQSIRQLGRIFAIAIAIRQRFEWHEDRGENEQEEKLRMFILH